MNRTEFYTFKDLPILETDKRDNIYVTDSINS